MNNNNQQKTRVRICPQCNKQFSTKAALHSHMISVHNVTANQPTTVTNRSRSRRRSRSVASIVTGPSTNYDGTARLPGQAIEDAAFGSSANRGALVPRARLSAANNRNFQESVANVIGSTPEGRAWALAALHPCGAGEVLARNVGALRGMCDTMTGSVATPVYRGENHITYAPTLFNNSTVKPETATTYGVDIIIPPIPEIDFVYRLIDDATGLKSYWVVVRLPDFQLPTPSKVGDFYGYDSNVFGINMSSIGYGKVRQIACGHTIELDASAINDQGRIVVGQMEGQWTQYQLGTPNVAVDTFSRPEPNQPAKAVTNIYGQDATMKTWHLEVPTDPTVITANCPNAYQGLAKEGAYVVTKFTSPLLGYSFKRSGSNRVHVDGDIANPVVGYWNHLPDTAFSINGSGSHASIASSDGFISHLPESKAWSAFTSARTWLEGGAAGQNEIEGSTFHPFISEPSDMMTAVVTIRNLSAKSEASSTSSVRVKSRNYYECISNGTNGAIAPYIHPPATFDFPALNSVIVAGKQLADAYPACANSLGSILGKVWGALRRFVKPVAQVVGGTGLPVVSNIANGVNSLFETVDDIAQSFR